MDDNKNKKVYKNLIIKSSLPVVYDVSDEEIITEDAITEIGQLSILTSSRFSLRQQNIVLDATTATYISNRNLAQAVNEDTSLSNDIETSREHYESESLLKRLCKIKGFLFIFVYGFFFALSTIFMKRSYLLAGSDNSVIRNILQFSMMTAIIYVKKLNFFGPKEQRILLSVRGFLGQCAMVSLHFSVSFIAPSDSVAITNSSLIVASIMAKLFLKEKFTIAHFFSLFLTIIGIVLISQPTFLFGYPDMIYTSTNDSLNCTFNQTLIDRNLTSHCLGQITNTDARNYTFYFGIFFGLLFSFCSGTVQILIKKLCIQKIHFAVSTIYSCYFGLPISIAISLTLYLTGVSYQNFNSDTHLEELPLQLAFSLASALCGIISQICLNLALQYEDASKITILKTFDLLFTFILQYLVLRISPNILSIVGASLILLGSFIVIGYKIILDKITEHQKIRFKNDFHI